MVLASRSQCLEGWLQAFGMLRTDRSKSKKTRLREGRVNLRNHSRPPDVEVALMWCLYEGSDYGLSTKGYLDFLKTSC